MEELYAQINELRYLLEEINKREINKREIVNKEKIELRYLLEEINKREIVNKEKIELLIKNRMITLENQLSDEIERVIKSVGEENE